MRVRAARDEHGNHFGIGVLARSPVQQGPVVPVSRHRVGAGVELFGDDRGAETLHRQVKGRHSVPISHVQVASHSAASMAVQPASATPAAAAAHAIRSHRRENFSFPGTLNNESREEGSCGHRRLPPREKAAISAMATSPGSKRRCDRARPAHPFVVTPSNRYARFRITIRSASSGRLPESACDVSGTTPRASAGCLHRREMVIHRARSSSRPGDTPAGRPIRQGSDDSWRERAGNPEPDFSARDSREDSDAAGGTE